MRRAVITGIGLVTALGAGTDATWQGLLAGRSGVAPIRNYDASSLRTQIGGEIPDFDASQFVSNRRTLRMMTRNDQLSLAGAALAVSDSGLQMEQEDLDRAALFVGGNKDVCDPMRLAEATLLARNEDGSVDVARFGEAAQTAAYPLFYVEGLQAASLFYISQSFGLKGANTYFSGAAESGAVAIGTAFRAVRRGEAEVAIAGGFDDPVFWWTMTTRLDALGIMTDQNQLGSRACRPYDLSRTGTVPGEGAAFLVVEEREHALGRSAQVYAEISGFGTGFDAYKLLTPHPDGRGLGVAMRSALREAGSSADSIDYIAAHGSGTQLGDVSEARAIRALAGDAAGQLIGSSVKPATGHLMAGAGALNVAVAALAIRDQRVPPTLNLENLDPECILDWVPGRSREANIHQALALARGLQGQNVAIALRAPA